MADLGDPHLRKRAEAREDGAADPVTELALRRRNDVDLDDRPGHLGDLLLQAALLTGRRGEGWAGTYSNAALHDWHCGMRNRFFKAACLWQILCLADAEISQ